MPSKANVKSVLLQNLKTTVDKVLGMLIEENKNMNGAIMDCGGLHIIQVRLKMVSNISEIKTTAQII